jgi:chemotaxis protein MotB
MHSLRTAIPLSLAAALLASGCVTTGTFNEKVAELNKRNDEAEQKAKAEDDASKAKIADLEKQLADTQAQLKDVQAKLKDTQSHLAAMTGSRDDLSKKLDAAVQKHTGEKSELFQTLAKAKQQLDTASKQLEELNRAKAAAEARAATYQDLTKKLRAMTDAGQLKVQIREGRMLIALPNDVLFQSGKATLKQEGKDALGQLAGVLKTFTDRKFQIAGHTDDDPIKTSRFPSNWELSTARAVDVTRYLIAEGMDPKQVSAVGYGEFAPVVANDTDEHKAQNRRIEIALQPNIADLPQGDGGEAK